MSTLTTTVGPPPVDHASVVRRQARAATLKALGVSLLTFLLTLVGVALLWQIVLWTTDISPYVAKGPADVWNFFFTVDDAADNRAEILGNLAVTLGDAAVGFSAGLLLALLGAIGFRLSRGFEHAMMPIALLLRSVPLVAFAPIIIMIFGREFLTVAVMGGIVVLFPALVNIAFGLQQASEQTLEVVQVYGGGPLKQLTKVALPSSLPAFFAAVRVSVPGAITGALLAEWLATGSGIGGVINGYSTSAKFNELWASVVVVTLVSLVLYNLVAILENTVLARMGMHPTRRI
ncbi:ABC transporter permease subunit [Demequina capsici]|uniref:ABC transporter permease subunit n=1 Tax=Demequina capsici TaxID=3075620 RepID=A0AA96J9N5_9MICO|nr:MULTISPECIES: ABC transporter permease subunit [unclassified Demequina]WNM23686.1 ABC transporter permease subunit [Demequina sp. OYTSA14]WNM26525.1 ABC transporter permease subunit [Demequina sp. PMTSA13]